MGLKDLVASKSSLAEEVIEEIVSDYIRFDTDHKAVFLTAEGQELSNKAKILIYLVALQGWPFVMEEAVSRDAKPAELEEHTGIAGGTLRPLLKELKDRRLVIEKAGRYSVLAASLRSIRAELASAPKTSTTRKAKARRRKEDDITDEGAEVEETDAPEYVADKVADARSAPASTKKQPKRLASNTNLADRFNSWIDEGFFDDWKGLSDVQKRFHKEAILVPMTSMPKYLLRGVRAGRLERDKREVNGRTVWGYRKVK